MTKCAACNRDASSAGDNDNNNNNNTKKSYCIYHLRAVEQLKSHYSYWMDAYSSGISWQEFLARLLDMDETGQWVKDVIREELKNK
jgi:hypothetical protein